MAKTKPVSRFQLDRRLQRADMWFTRIVLLSVVLIGYAFDLQARSYGDPKDIVFMSPNRRFLFHVAVGDGKNGGKKAIGTLFEIDGQDPEAAERGVTAIWSSFFRPHWKVELPNPIAPACASISDDGRYVVTTDEYDEVGRGENVVVIYGEGGTIIKKIRLNELLKQPEIDKLEGDIDIIWGGRHVIDAEKDRLILKIRKGIYPGTGFRDLVIDLRTGKKLK